VIIVIQKSRRARKGLTSAKAQNNHEDCENRGTYMERKEEAIL
jgi:hypothetical protein